MPLTAVPERTGLSQAFGGLAAALVGTAKYYLWLDEGELTSFRMAVVAGEVILGCLTCTGGLMAAGKLAEWIPTRPVTYKGQNIVSFAAARRGRRRSASGSTMDPTQSWAFPIIIALALIFGVLLILPIGGADMPTVISFLNSYAGLSAVAMGFVLENKLLIAAGALDGASGLRAVDHHVQGDEPIGDQRAVRRVRLGAGRRPRSPNSARSRARRRPMPPSCSPTPTAS